MTIDILSALGTAARSVSVALDADGFVRLDSPTADQIPVEGSTDFGRAAFLYAVTEHDEDRRVGTVYLELTAGTQYRVLAFA